MATSNRRPLIVGIFIFLGLVILIVGVLTLGGRSKTFTKSVVVNTVFDDVGGLQRGANIWFSGVKIGTVKKMQFQPNSQVAISMSIDEASQKYIHKDAKAKLSTDGLIGNKIIVIFGGTANSDLIEEGDNLFSEKPLDTDAMMATLQENNRNLIDITGDFKIIGKRLVKGEGTIGTLLSDSIMAMKLRTTLNNLNDVSNNLKTATRNSNAVVKSFGEFAARLNTEGGLANELVTDTVVFSNLKMVVSQLQQAASDASAITKNINAATIDLTNKGKPIGMLLSDEETASQLKNTIKNLETSTQKLDENMEALQHNFLLRGFFRRKAKNKQD
ncbi:MAG: MlaD family protein [Chitinophagaceae bacterium]